MAAQQKRELEETELKVPDSIPLCSESSDLKIYKQDEPPPPPQPHQISSFVSNAKLTDRESVALRSPAVASSDLKMCKQDPSRLSSVSSTVTNNDLMTMNKKRKREVNRCSRADCCKRVGLIPFRCRCGEVFCSEHRYSDRHDCNYDYKSAGRKAIAKENPVVKAPKIIKV
ncbi:zinc finger A20 and AN1 domain-containing stress-associated protein 5 [Capsicum galapagoense]